MAFRGALSMGPIRQKSKPFQCLTLVKNLTEMYWPPSLTLETLEQLRWIGRVDFYDYWLKKRSSELNANRCHQPVSSAALI